MITQKTYTPKQKDLKPQWFVVDAEGKVLGRLASGIARILRGKHKANFAPHLDTGDHVVVINAAKVVLTGDKLSSKRYYRHSGYPGGLREMTAAEVMAKNPAKVVELSVAGMLPKNRLGRKLARKLHVYAGPDHPHVAQKPEPLEV